MDQSDQYQIEPPGTEAEMTPRADHGEVSYRGSGKLSGRVAVITGGDSGIGRAVAIAYAREGADMLISYLNEQEDADARETMRHVEAAGRRCVLMPGDIAEAVHCRAIIDRAVAEFGHIDILVNNAAFQRMYKSLDEISEEEWDYNIPHQHHCHVPPRQGRCAPHAAGLFHHQHHVDTVRQAQSNASGLRRDQGCCLQLHRRSGPDAGEQGHSRERGGARSDLDTVDSLNHAS
jgi:hypothetical protein